MSDQLIYTAYSFVQKSRLMWSRCVTVIIDPSLLSFTIIVLTLQHQPPVISWQILDMADGNHAAHV